MLRQNDEITNVSYYYIKLDDVRNVEKEPGKPALLNTEHDTYYSACINCSQPRCMYFYDSEFECPAFGSVAGNPDNRVCAFGAIEWNNEAQSIVIKEDACTGCGLCASRCPYGALYYEDGRMQVSIERSDELFELIKEEGRATSRQEQCRERMAYIPSSKEREDENLSRVEYVYMRLEELQPSNDTNLLFCRNLMIGSGYNCALSRTGVVSNRMDAVYSGGDASGAIEIELQNDSLSVARNLLDDISMMEARAGLPASSNTPLALCLHIPNTRQGFYQLCDDIRKVLGVNIRTVTVAALLLLVWNDTKLDLTEGRFCLGFRDTSIQQYLEDILGFALDARNALGFLEPLK